MKTYSFLMNNVTKKMMIWTEIFEMTGVHQFRDKGGNLMALLSSNSYAANNLDG